MVLLINGRVQSTDGETGQTLVQALYSNESVISKAESFKTLPLGRLNDGSSLLYVCQGEMAIVPSTGMANHKSIPRILASDDATSCCIIVLSSQHHHIIGHLDCKLRVKSFFDEVEKLNETNNPTSYKLHIVGGYLDEYGVADEMLANIFSKVALPNSNTYELGICCIGKLNLKHTNSTGPAVLGITYDCKHGLLKPCMIGWSARNPLAILRLSRLYSGTGDSLIANVFDYEQRCLSISPFNYSSYCLTRSPIVSIEQLRSHSTTPEHEPPTYFEGSAAVNRLIFYYPNPLSAWFSHGSLKFVCTPGSDAGAWTPIDSHSAFVSNHSIFALPK